MESGTLRPPSPHPHAPSPLPFPPGPGKGPSTIQAQEREERLRLLFLQQPDHPCSPRQHHPTTEDADVAGEQRATEQGSGQTAEGQIAFPMQLGGAGGRGGGQAWKGHGSEHAHESRQAQGQRGEGQHAKGGGPSPAVHHRKGEQLVVHQPSREQAREALAEGLCLGARVGAVPGPLTGTEVRPEAGTGVVGVVGAGAEAGPVVGSAVGSVVGPGVGTGVGTGVGAGSGASARPVVPAPAYSLRPPRPRALPPPDAAKSPPGCDITAAVTAPHATKRPPGCGCDTTTAVPTPPAAASSGTGVLSLPDEALVEILTRVSSSSASLSFAAACPKFRDLVPECVTAVSVAPGKLLSEASLLRSLEVYRQLSALSLGRESVDRISDALLSFLALRRPAIESLELAFTRDCTATGRGLGMVLRSCTALGALSLEGWGKGCIPDLFHSLPRLRSLVLELPCNVLPESLGALAQLRSLKVSRKYGRNIKVPVSLLALTQLQELSIDCWDLSGAQECIGSLVSLTALHLSLRFPYQLPWSLEGLTNLERLSLNCRYLEVLPEGLGQLTRLESLVFVCPFLRTLPETMAPLQRLRTLEVSVRGCLTLPTDLWDLKSLEDLKIKCRHLVPMSPWGLTRMPKLRNLAVKCASVAPAAVELLYDGPQTMFPDDLGHLKSSLVSLSLRSERMSRLPGNLGQLESLKRLILVAEEPEKGWGMLQMRPTECLRRLPESIPLIKNLEELHIIRCRWLRELPASLGQLTNLKTAIFRDCPRLEGLPGSVGQLTSLEELEIEGCGAKKLRFTLPDNFQGLPGLKRVSVACLRLQIFPRSLLRLTSLESLSIGCGARQLADAFDPACALQELTFVGCWRLTAIPESVGCLKRLEQLMIKDCRALRRLPESLGQLELLKKLQVVQCPPLAFPKTFGDLQRLEDLYINMRIRTLPDSLAQLKSLKTLHLRSLRVRAFPEVVHRLSGLHSLTLCGWPRLEEVSGDLSRLVSLRKLMICCCPKLKHLPRSILEMPNLSRGCRELLALEFDLSWLQPDDADLAHNCDWLH